MLRSRRVALSAAALLIGLSACGDATSRTQPANSPAVIRLGAGSSGGKEAAATADRMMMPMFDITYVFDGTVPDLGATGASWTFPAGTSVDEDRVAAIAKVFGVEGEVRALPADQGGGWMVGAPDYTTANLTVSSDGMATWWFNPAPQSYAGTCEVLIDPIDTTGGGTDGSDGEGAAANEPAPPEPATTEPSTIVGGDAVAPPDVPCGDMPAPPTNVPNEAAAKARTLFTQLGYDMSNFELDVYADEWGANVMAYLMLNGSRTPISLSVGFGEDGAITWASGALARPVQSSDYPLVSIERAVERLNDESGRYLYFGGGPSPMARTEALVDVAGSDIAVEQPVDVGVELEPITVTLTSVRLDLTMVWDADGVVWLLPAYTFSDADGGFYTVIAVDDSFIELPEELPVPEPMPVDTVVVDPDTGTGPDAGVDVPAIDQAEANEALVGLTLDEATKVGEEFGWTIRVSTLDGQPQALTMDLRMDRVNVAVVDGVVTGVEFLG